MSAPTSSIQPDQMVALSISDRQMVFRSTDAPPLRKSNKKEALNRLKLRRDTPAPPTKGNGRKRYVLSPFPEDNPLRKRIDFGEEEGLPSAPPKYKGTIFPTKPHDGMGENLQIVAAENDLIKKDKEMGLYCAAYNNVVEIAPDSGQAAGAGDEKVVDEVEDKLPSQLRPMGDTPAGAKGILVGELVNLPKMVMETKPLLESALVPCQLDKSHRELVVECYVQPKKDNILLLANPNSADMLDTTVAQPLLAGGKPEEAQMAVGLHTDPSWKPIITC